MVINCAVLNCKSKTSDDDKKSFFSIPIIITKQSVYTKELSAKRRDSWIKALNQSKFSNPAYKIGRSHRVCSAHFITGKPAWLQDTNHPDWTPSLLMGYNKFSISTPISKINRYNRALERARRDRVSPKKVIDMNKILYFTCNEAKEKSTEAIFQEDLTQYEERDIDMEESFVTAVGSQCSPLMVEIGTQTKFNQVENSSQTYFASYSSVSVPTDLKSGHRTKLESTRMAPT